MHVYVYRIEIRFPRETQSLGCVCVCIEGGDSGEPWVLRIAEIKKSTLCFFNSEDGSMQFYLVMWGFWVWF